MNEFLKGLLHALGGMVVVGFVITVSLWEFTEIYVFTETTMNIYIHGFAWGVIAYAYFVAVYEYNGDFNE